MFKTFNIGKLEVTLEFNWDLSYWALPLAIYWFGFTRIYGNHYLTFRILCFNFTLDIWNHGKEKNKS